MERDKCWGCDFDGICASDVKRLRAAMRNAKKKIQKHLTDIPEEKNALLAMDERLSNAKKTPEKYVPIFDESDFQNSPLQQAEHDFNCHQKLLERIQNEDCPRDKMVV